jgi:hypothetical protein
MASGSRLLFRALAGMLVLPALFLGLGAAAGAVQPLTLEDVLHLLEAGVGTPVVMRQIDATDSRFDLGVDDLVRLKRAGADDILLEALLSRSAAPEPARPPADAGPPAAVDGIRVYRTHTEHGDAIVLTNLDDEGRPLSPRRASPPPAPFEAAARRDGPDEADSGLVDRLAVQLDRLDDRLDEESARPAATTADVAPREPEPAPVGAGFSRPQQEVTYWPWGIPLYVPIAFQPEPFKVRSFGPFLSFTGARAAGVDPFNAPGPCQPGVACSIEQRLQQP